mmetsp:Transcript_25033/g.56328  ORF Transcript_25033/g.56328 Transcript_25033/m.56328 type:complete len:459 (-) Transcript_25033:293-1669(-)
MTRGFVLGAALLSLTESSFPESHAPPIATSDNYDQDYFSRLLEHFNCNISEAVAHVQSPLNNRTAPPVTKAELAAVAKGGFGAQLVLGTLPRAVSAVMVGARVTMDLENWNYGCPGHENAADVLNSISSTRQDVLCCHSKFVTSSTRDIPNPPVCKGDIVPLNNIRSAVANSIFQLTPFFKEAVDNILKPFSFPPHFLAVHVRGGDKLVSEWRGPHSHMADVSSWVTAISKALEHERAHFTPDISPVVFVESDDCKLIVAIKAQAPSDVTLVHIPCTVHEAVEYVQRGNKANITGHHQWHFNKEHTCDDISRYFAGLAVFRDATAVLLGNGGVDGTPRNPAKLTSNTVLLIELLRKGRTRLPLGHDYHISSLKSMQLETPVLASSHTPSATADGVLDELFEEADPLELQKLAKLIQDRGLVDDPVDRLLSLSNLPGTLVYDLKHHTGHQVLDRDQGPS